MEPINGTFNDMRQHYANPLPESRLMHYLLLLTVVQCPRRSPIPQPGGSHMTPASLSSNGFDFWRGHIDG